MRDTITEVKRTSEPTDQSGLNAYKKAGRWIVRGFGPWADVTEAFRCGLAEDGFIEIESTVADE